MHRGAFGNRTVAVRVCFGVQEAVGVAYVLVVFVMHDETLTLYYFKATTVKHDNSRDRYCQALVQLKRQLHTGDNPSTPERGLPPQACVDVFVTSSRHAVATKEVLHFRKQRLRLIK